MSANRYEFVHQLRSVQGDPAMSDKREPINKRLLDPVSRVSEVLFGLIMALTFTGTLSAATAGRDEVRIMLFGAIGCNIAWGLVDGVMFLIGRLIERGRDLRTVRVVRQASDPAAARQAIAEELPPLLMSNLPEGTLEVWRRRLTEMSEFPARPRLSRHDLLCAVAVFLLVAVSTFPVVVPFFFMHNAMLALRVSNGIAVVMLFLCGYRLGRYSDNRPWLLGVSMALIGSALVAITIALGG
jgi:hypothetical protein